MAENITILHLSDMQFGIHHRFGAKDTELDSLLNRLLEDLSELEKQDSSLKPDLIILSGDLTEWGKKAEFADLFTFVSGLSEKLNIPRKQIIMVAGNHDINWTKCKHYFEVCDEEGEIPKKPYWKKWEFFTRFFADFYADEPAIQFTEEKPYSLFEIEELKIVVAGLNSTMNESHRDEDHYGCIGEEQLKWFKAELEQYKQKGWFRIAAVHHNVQRGADYDNENLKDADDLTRLLKKSVNLVLHGHTHQADLGWLTQKAAILATGSAGLKQDIRPDGVANQYQLIQLQAQSLKRYCRAFIPSNKKWGWDNSVHENPAEPFETEEIAFENINATFPIEPELESTVSTVIIPVKTEITKQFSISSEPEPQFIKPIPITPPFTKPNFKLYGRELLIKDTIKKLNQQPFLLVYGLRGNGKSKLIEALAQESPLKNKELHRFSVSSYTTADGLFRQIATLLGEIAEFPKAPQGDIASIAAAIKRRYPNPRPAWLWIENAHLLLSGQGFCHPEVRLLLLGLQAVLGIHWHFVLEWCERPPQGVFGYIANECEVLGLDRNNLQQWLQDAAPLDATDAWSYKGDELKRIYQWLGGGHGGQAHTLATQLLIEIACGQHETPLHVLQRHRENLSERIEELLLGELYSMLNADEQTLLQVFALYRSTIPYDHVDFLGQHLNLINVKEAWKGLDRRCLLSTDADHDKYYLHSFIAGWLRTSQLGYDTANDEDDNNDFAMSASLTQKQLARSLHLAIAECWLDQLGKNPRMTRFSIKRALEAFHHFIAAGNVYAVQSIAFELLSENQDWAEQRIAQLYNHLFKTHAPIKEQRIVLEYALHLNSNNSKFQRFLGECWTKEEDWASSKALACFEQACYLNPDFPQSWANLGKALLNHGREGAEDFLKRLEKVEQQYPKAINDHVRSVQSDCLILIGDTQQASTLRMERINAGSKHPSFYVNEAKVRHEAGDNSGALDILSLAKQRGCANEFTDSTLASVLQIKNPKKARELRMKYINANSKDPVFYASEALVLHETGKNPEALAILDKAKHNGCANDVIANIRTKILQTQNR